MLISRKRGTAQDLPTRTCDAVARARTDSHGWADHTPRSDETGNRAGDEAIDAVLTCGTCDVMRPRLTRRIHANPGAAERVPCCRLACVRGRELPRRSAQRDNHQPVSRRPVTTNSGGGDATPCVTWVNPCRFPIFRSSRARQFPSLPSQETPMHSNRV